MSSDKTPPDDKIKAFPTIPGGKKSTGKISKPKSRDARNQIYVTDASFKRAMELIREDMNRALELGSVANTQNYFLIRYLIKKGLIDEQEFTAFMQEEVTKLEQERET